MQSAVLRVLGGLGFSPPFLIKLNDNMWILKCISVVAHGE